MCISQVLCTDLAPGALETRTLRIGYSQFFLFSFSVAALAETCFSVCPSELLGISGSSVKGYTRHWLLALASSQNPISSPRKLVHRHGKMDGVCVVNLGDAHLFLQLCPALKH